MYEHHTPSSHGPDALRHPDHADRSPLHHPEHAPQHAAEHAGDAPELTVTGVRSAGPEALAHAEGPPNHAPLHAPLFAPLHAPLTGGRPPWGRP